MQLRTIRLEITIECDGEWPGDDEACQLVLNHIPSGIIELDDDNVLLIKGMAAEMVQPLTMNPPNGNRAA